MSKFKLEIRPATVADLDGLVKLENACFETDKFSRRNYLRTLKKATAEIIVALVDHEIIGHVITFYRKNSKKSRIYSLAVANTFRNQGIANQLMSTAESNAAKRGCGQLILEVNEKNNAAVHFYKKQNFYIFGSYKSFYANGDDALRMAKNI